MEWTTEQQTEINKMIEEATTKATQGFFTKEQLDSEIDKAKQGLFNEETVTKRVQSETDKVRTEYSKKLKSVEDELVKYKPKEKSDAEKALEAREAEIAKKEKVFKIKESLGQNNLPTELCEILTGEGEDIDKNITRMSEILSKYAELGSFKPSPHKKSDNISKEDFKRMSYTDRVKLLETNPQLYKQLSSL